MGSRAVTPIASCVSPSVSSSLWVSFHSFCLLLTDLFASPQKLQQENHELRRGLAARGAEWEARAVELEGDVEALRAQLGEQRSEQQDSGRERAKALGELSEQNLRLSQQLAQVGWPGSLGRWGLTHRSSVGASRWTVWDGTASAPSPQASRTEQELQRELDTLRGQCQAQALAGAELRARLESLQAEVRMGWGSLPLAQAAPCPSLCLISDTCPQNQMLQDRRQDLEAQIRGLREEVDKGQGRLQATHEELLLLRRERKEHRLEVIRGTGNRGQKAEPLATTS